MNRRFFISFLSALIAPFLGFISKFSLANTKDIENENPKRLPVLNECDNNIDKLFEGIPWECEGDILQEMSPQIRNTRKILVWLPEKYHHKFCWGEHELKQIELKLKGTTNRFEYLSLNSTTETKTKEQKRLFASFKSQSSYPLHGAFLKMDNP